jgi:peptide/nickel transport system permease protein
MIIRLRYYLLRRILLQVFVIFAAITITFFATKAIPGNPVAVLIGPRGMRDPNQVKAVISTWKLDQPLWIQFYWYISNILHGNFGISISTRNLVTVDLSTRLPATIELVIFGFIIAMAIAIPLGVISSTHRGSAIDHLARILSITGLSAPSFWWGILFLLIFYLWLGFTGFGSGRLSTQCTSPPFVTGMYTIDSLISGRFDTFLDALTHLILPAFTLGITCCGLTMRLTRSSMLEIINSDYIRVAKMKGLSERIVIYKHALRNALIPTVTYAPILFGSMITGSVLIETIFNWNGVGQYAVTALFSSDTPALIGVTLTMAIIYSTGNLLADLLYTLIDPRVRLGG